MSSTETNADALTTTIGTDRHVSEIVVTSVAAAKGVNPLELEPLFGTVDPDALDALFGSANRPSGSDLELRFSIGGCQVVVREGEVAVTPPVDDRDAPTPIAQPRT